MSVKVATPSEITAEDHALTELSSLTEHRRTRLLQSKYQLPTIFWGVLLIGGSLTVTSASMFGSANRPPPRLQVFCLHRYSSPSCCSPLPTSTVPSADGSTSATTPSVRAQENMNE